MNRPYRVEFDPEGRMFITLRDVKIGYSVRKGIGFERVVVDNALEAVFEIEPTMLEQIYDEVIKMIKEKK